MPKVNANKRKDEPSVLHLLLNLYVIKGRDTGTYKPPQDESLDDSKKSFQKINSRGNPQPITIHIQLVVFIIFILRFYLSIF